MGICAAGEICRGKTQAVSRCSRCGQPKIKEHRKFQKGEMMEKLSAILAFILFAIPAQARVTSQGATDRDTFCVGPSGAEVCADSSGNFIPTTDNDTTLGTSALRWSDIRAYDMTLADDLTVTDDATVSDDLTVTGDSFKTMVATVTVLSGDIISVAGACGGILRLTATTNVSTALGDTFTAPAAANAGCIIMIVNSGGSGVITLDDNSNFDTGLGYPSSGAIMLGTSDSIIIGSLGTRWLSFGTVSDN